MTPDQLTEARQRLGLSRRGLASALGADRNTVNRWEAGETQIPFYISLAIETLQRREDDLGDDPLGDHHGRNV